MTKLNSNLLLSLLPIFFVSCGQDDNREEAISTSASSSIEASSSAISSSLTDALESLSDGNLSSNSQVGLSSQDQEDGIILQRQRSCSSTEGSSLVSISDALSGSISFSGRFASNVRTVEGSGSITRTLGMGMGLG